MDFEKSSTFAERLMESEGQTDELRRRYDSERLALMERRLNPLQKGLGWLSVPFYVVLIAGLGYRLLIARPAQTREWDVLEAASGLGLLALGGWILRVLLKGGRVTWRDDRAMEWIGGIGLITLCFALFEVARSLDDAGAALRLQGVVTVLLVGGAFGILLERIRLAKLEMRVLLLELELRMIEPAKGATPQGPAANP